MNRDRDLLLGVMAVQMGRVTPQQLAESASEWAANPSVNLGQLLLDRGIIGEDTHRLVLDCVDQSLGEFDGDANATLHAFGGPEQVRHSFAGAVDPSTIGGAVTVAVDEEELNSPPADLQGVAESPGRYAFQAEYARGGMGRVLLVRDEHLGRDVALKEMLPKDADSEAAVPGPKQTAMMARFLREAKITGQLEHPSIVPVHELGKRADGSLYYTMKFVRGKTLADAIRSAGGLNGRLRLLPHYLDLCNAVAYAHSRNVLHRDLKPGNVMIGEFGETVVLDWGIATHKENQTDEPRAGASEAFAHSTHELAQTKFGTAIGTPGYMPPEQEVGDLDNIDERSDVYALGAILYELLTSTAPIDSQVTGASPAKRRALPVRPIRSVVPNVPKDLAAIADKAMADEPAERYQTAKELADEVERFQSGALVEAHQYGPREYGAYLWKRYRAALAAVAAVIVLLIGIGVTYTYTVFQGGLRERELRIATEDALTQAVVARDTAQYRQYIASLYQIDHLMGDDNEAAMEMLWATDERFRNWEWGYLLLKADRSLATREIRAERYGQGQLIEVETSPDGRHGASVDLGKLELFDVLDFHHSLTLADEDIGAGWLRFGPQGETLYAEFAPTNSLLAYDLQKHAEKWRYTLDSDQAIARLRRPQVSSEGTRVAAAFELREGSFIVAALDSASGREFNQFAADKQLYDITWVGDTIVVACGTKPNERFVYFEHDASVQFRDLHSGEILADYPGYGLIQRIPGSEHVLLVNRLGVKPVLVCDESGHTIKSLPPETTPEDIAVIHGGADIRGVLLAGLDGAVNTLSFVDSFRIDNKPGAFGFPRRFGYFDYSGDFITYDDRRLIAALTFQDVIVADFFDRKIYLGEIGLKRPFEFHGHTNDPILGLGANRDHFVSMAGDQSLRLWDLAGVREQTHTAVRSREIANLYPQNWYGQADGNYLVTMDHRRIHVWSWGEPDPVWEGVPDRILGAFPWSMRVALSAHHDRLLIHSKSPMNEGEGNQTAFTVLDLNSKRHRTVWETWDSPERYVEIRTFPGTNRFMTWDRSDPDEPVHVWDYHSDEPLRVPTDGIGDAVPVTDELLVRTHKQSIELLDLTSMKPLWRVQDPKTPLDTYHPEAAALSSNGQYIAIGVGNARNGAVTVYSMKNGEPVTAPLSHVGIVRKIHFTPDTGRLIVITGAIEERAMQNEDSVYVWDWRKNWLVFEGDVQSPTESSGGAMTYGQDGQPATPIDDFQLAGFGIYAAPWRVNDLPGDDSMNWRARYQMWKTLRYEEWARRRLAELQQR